MKNLGPWKWNLRTTYAKQNFPRLIKTSNNPNYKQYADIHTKQKVYFPTLRRI